MAMNPSIKFIYIDIGDTIFVDNAELVGNALGVQKEIFRKALNENRLALYKGILSPLEFVGNLRNKLNISPKEAIKKWDMALSNFSPIEPMHKLAEDLKEKYKVGLLTNIFLGHFEVFYNFGKIPHLSYDAVVKSCDIGFAKPEKEIYEIATKKINVNPQEIFFIENKKEYVDAAINYGWKGFVFETKNPIESVNKLRNILL